MNEQQLRVLELTVEENYAHARDHENLRGQVTATLVAAAFVLIGLIVNQGALPSRIRFAAFSSMLIGLLNVVLVVIHNNRFDYHVSIARNAKNMIAVMPVNSDVPKRLSLSWGCLFVACLPIVAGGALLLID